HIYMMMLLFQKLHYGHLIRKIIRVGGHLHLEIYFGLIRSLLASRGAMKVIIWRSLSGLFPGMSQRERSFPLPQKAGIMQSRIIITILAISYCSVMTKCF